MLAILLLALVGGAVVWKLSQKEPPPRPLTLPDASLPVPVTRNTDDEIPLPPPVEDAGMADAGKKSGTMPLASQCDAKKCSGTSTSELESGLAFRAKQAHRCYDNALTQDATLRGKISISVRVGANGSVCSASVASNDMGTPAVANCVAGYFRSGSFPAPKGGCADIAVPISFVPRQ